MRVWLFQNEKLQRKATVKWKPLFHLGRICLNYKYKAQQYTCTSRHTVFERHTWRLQTMLVRAIFIFQWIQKIWKLLCERQNLEGCLILNSAVRLTPCCQADLSWIFQCPCGSRVGVGVGVVGQRALLYISHLIITRYETLGGSWPPNQRKKKEKKKDTFSTPLSKQRWGTPWTDRLTVALKSCIKNVFAFYWRNSPNKPVNTSY